MNPVILSDNRFADATPTATGTATGYDPANIADRRPYTLWVAPAVGTHDITVQASGAANAFAIAGHNLKTAGATVTLQSSDDGTTWTDRASVTPASDDPLLIAFASVTAAWGWRLHIVTTAAAAQIGVAMVGTRLEFPFPPEAPFVPERVTPVTEQTISKAGHLLGVVERYQKVAIDPAWKNLDRTWVEQTLRPWWDAVAARRLPFFWAYDLDAYPDLVHYVRHTGDWRAPISVGSLVDQVALKLEGVL